MLLKTESQIISNWPRCTSNITVSVLCATYNHENYITEAIEGFLMQETNFPFEILIRDDSSIDKTAKIIKRYAEQYPQLIKPLFEKENTYSKGIGPMSILYKLARGKYIALCEGDDYWINSEKLQVQVDLMRRYPDINISFHPAYEVNSHKLKKDKVFSSYGDEIRIFNSKEVALGGGGFMPTASILFKKECLNKRFYSWLEQSTVGDLTIQIFCSKKMGALYLPKIYSIYRQNIDGSWSGSFKNCKEQIDHRKKATNYFYWLSNEESELSSSILKLSFRANLIASVFFLKGFQLTCFTRMIPLVLKSLILYLVSRNER